MPGPRRLLWLPLSLAAALLWSTIGVVYRYAVMEGANPSWLILGRPLIGAAASAAAAVLGYGRPTRWSMLIGSTTLAPLIILYLKAVELVGAALASILLYTAPIWVIALSPLVLRERPAPVHAAAAALGFTGVVLIAYPSLHGGSAAPLEGVAIGLLAGVSYAAYMLTARLAQLHGATILETGLHSQLFAALAVAVVVHPSKPPSGLDFVWMLYLGVATMVIPYILHVRALGMAEAYLVAIVSLAEPVSANILAHVALDETLSGLQLAGAALVLLAALAAAAPPGSARGNS